MKSRRRFLKCRCLRNNAVLKQQSQTERTPINLAAVLYTCCITGNYQNKPLSFKSFMEIIHVEIQFFYCCLAVPNLYDIQSNNMSLEFSISFDFLLAPVFRGTINENEAALV